MVITYQETGLLHLPAIVQVGPPLMWRWSKVNLTPSRLGGGWEVEQPNEGCLRPPHFEHYNSVPPFWFGIVAIFSFSCALLVLLSW